MTTFLMIDRRPIKEPDEETGVRNSFIFRLVSGQSSSKLQAAPVVTATARLMTNETATKLGRESEVAT